MVKNLASRLQTLLDERGLGAVQASTKMGLKRDYLRDIIRKNRNDAPYDKLLTIADFFDVDVEYLICSTDIRKGDQNRTPPNLQKVHALMQVVYDYIQDRRLEFTGEEFADFAMLIYQMADEDGNVPRQAIDLLTKQIRK